MEHSVWFVRPYPKRAVQSGAGSGSSCVLPCAPRTILEDLVLIERLMLGSPASTIVSAPRKDAFPGAQVFMKGIVTNGPLI